MLRGSRLSSPADPRPISNDSLVLSPGYHISDMIWMKIKMPVLIYKPSLEASSAQWPLNGISPAPWPEESLFNRVISRANGLFIFIKTVVLALEHCKDPSESLEATLQDSSGPGLNSLYALYSSILKARIMPRDAEFQRVIGVLLTTAPYRSLCEETIAELAGVRPNLVKKWVDDLSSLLYRDEGAMGQFVSGICQYPISSSTRTVTGDYQVSVIDANVHLGIDVPQDDD
jgi:hypothetical protein